MSKLSLLYQWILLVILIVLFSHTNAAGDTSKHAIILQYHHVSNTTPKVTSISPEQFKWHLEYLDQNNFTIWPLSKIAQFLKEGKSLPDKCVAITFDDAYRSIYTTAFPLLKQRNWPFSLFLNTGAVGKSKNSLNWDEIREMSRSVAEIGNHSHTHAHLIRYEKNESPQQWRERVIGEIQTAQQMIDQHLSHEENLPPRLFAYPYGEYSVALAQIIKQLGYVAVSQQSGPVTLITPQELFPRFPMSGIYTTKSQLKEKLKTFPLPLETIDIIEPLLKPATEQDYDKTTLKLIIKPKYWNKTLRKKLQCYVSGQGKALIHWENQTAHIQAQKKLGVGRNRYNCTAPVSIVINGKARHGFYWYSQLWIKRHDNGEWYKE